MKKLNPVRKWITPAEPAAPRNVRVQSTTPRMTRQTGITGPARDVRPRDRFFQKAAHAPRPLTAGFRPDPGAPATPVIRITFVSRKDRRDAKHPDSGQCPKALAVRKHKPAEYERDATGAAITWTGREPRRIWLGGISAWRGY